MRAANEMNAPPHTHLRSHGLARCFLSLPPSRSRSLSFYRLARKKAVAAKTASRIRKRGEVYVPGPEVELLPDKWNRRRASKKIEVNRGLVAHRPNWKRNPRIVGKKKYEKRVKARKGQVRTMRSERGLGAYSGEAAGIRDDVTHSRQFTQVKAKHSHVGKRKRDVKNRGKITKQR